MVCCSSVATDSELVLTRDQGADLKRRLLLLSPSAVEDAYVEAHQRCCYDGKAIPAAATIQQLVTAWRVLRGFQKKTEARRTKLKPQE
jgi:hypothetical protein